MTITEIIKKLEAIRAIEGDIRVTVYDEYTFVEGWYCRNEDLWVDAEPAVNMVKDDDGKEIEKVVCMSNVL